MTTTTEKSRSSRKKKAAVPFNELIRDRRLELGLIQGEVATAVGMSSPEAIGMIEKGIRRLDFNRIPRLAKVLQLDKRALIRYVMQEQFPDVYTALYEED